MAKAEGQLLESRGIVGEPPAVQCAPEEIELAMRERIKELDCLCRMGEVAAKCCSSSKCAPEGIELALRERIKELNCLYQLSEIVENCGNSLDALLQGAVDILPDSWLYPKVACARITFGDSEHATSNFKNSPWKMAADIQIAGEKAGVVEVVYLQETPTLDEGPFLREERSLINAVAERLGKTIERIQTQTLLRERVKELNCLYRMGEVVEKCGNSSAALCQGIAEILPESWLYPEIACARIVFGGIEYATSNFKDSPWKLSADILVVGGKAGVVEVVYLEERASLDEGPFLREERSLIDAVAERLGKTIERIQAQEQVLAEKQSALQQKTIALQEVLAAVQKEKNKIGRAVLANVDKIIMPMLDALEQGLPDSQKRCVPTLKQSLKEIASPFVEKLSREFHSLTPMEIRICHHVKMGLSSKKMASIENISPGTVGTYRFQIRRKLGLLNKGINLASFLQQIMPESTNG